MRVTQLRTGVYYHVFNRGVDGRLIFQSQSDRQRFMDGLVAFNDVGRRSDHALGRAPVRVSATPYVRIICHALMPNHFHLLLRQETEDGISEFMRRIGTGYTRFFNIKYNRKGRLFSGPFKAIHVANDSYFQHLTRYILLNPLDLFMPEWRTVGVSSWEMAVAFLRQYRWASTRYVFKRTAPPFLGIQEAFASVGGQAPFRRFLQAWAAKDMGTVDRLALE
ncbi:hypothetical protein A2856_00155 [Candidatus Uhrbacteria bacterium RIFCSPHIGHO2_01_FULL_63_20]|uniref:Transposase IS200-like domain-containing protein n=1 Tax=Candidatus Uhrbacteria bacterium RIFCSPHIGHO2_01_FULL_63_20 TaxID=1802385 RepID=A0A1F7TLP5_9BACT|nr:MAG: hypothetical protein A2856_00155 [Candidatus Uhrbacteria bacterium RIFCSPHIGHO2_01_FULL_63_20]